MSLTPEERRLLAEQETQRPTRRRAEKPGPAASAQPDSGQERGPHTPVQWDDDGWNGLPVQMRG